MFVLLSSCLVRGTYRLLRVAPQPGRTGCIYAGKPAWQQEHRPDPAVDLESSRAVGVAFSYPIEELRRARKTSTLGEA